MDNPRGYFISLDVPKAAGRWLRKRGSRCYPDKAGATFPYGIEPEDKNIRLHPRFQHLELASAIEMCTCIELVALKILLNEVNR